jgi:predicted RNA-binding protein YlxR (DUF448 family)
LNAASSSPERTCVACRRKGARSSFVRLRRRSDGVVVPEFDPRTGGRSAWVCPTHACLDQATRRRAIARSLAGPRGLAVRQPPTAELWSAIVSGASARLDLLRRTGTGARVRALAALQQSLQQAGEDA